VLGAREGDVEPSHFVLPLATLLGRSLLPPRSHRREEEKEQEKEKEGGSKYRVRQQERERRENRAAMDG
jgi:hypothetical protein